MSLEPAQIEVSNENENETDELTFHSACAEGNLDVVKDYLAQPEFDMNTIGDDIGIIGSTGFHDACSNGQLTVVQFLLQEGFDMNIGDNYGRTGFHWACIDGNLNVVQFLLQEGYDMNIVINDGSTGFHLACLNGNLEVVEFFLQEGFDINIVDNRGTTGFHKACSDGSLEVIQLLLQEGFDINICDDEGITGFHEACSNGQLNVVQFLLQEGFDMKVGDNEENTGFYHAGVHGKLNIIQFLLEQGFQGIHEIGVDGKTVLEILFDDYNPRNDNIDFSLDNHHWMCVSPAILKYDEELFIQCIICLIEYGAQVNENYVFEELIHASKIRNIEITEIKKIIFENWTGRIAQAITDFTMNPIAITSSQNLLRFLTPHVGVLLRFYI